MSDPALKGVKNGNCNRTACQVEGADHYSVWTQAYYCKSCARMINNANRPHARRMYNVNDCVFIVANLSAADRASLTAAHQFVPLD